MTIQKLGYRILGAALLLGITSATVAQQPERPAIATTKVGSG